MTSLNVQCSVDTALMDDSSLQPIFPYYHHSWKSSTILPSIKIPHSAFPYYGYGRKIRWEVGAQPWEKWMGSLAVCLWIRTWCNYTYWNCRPIASKNMEPPMLPTKLPQSKDSKQWVAKNLLLNPWVLDILGPMSSWHPKLVFSPYPYSSTKIGGTYSWCCYSSSTPLYYETNPAMSSGCQDMTDKLKQSHFQFESEVVIIHTGWLWLKQNKGSLTSC